MNAKILNNANKIGIKVIKIETNFKKLIKTHKTYKEKKDVVGIDIKYEKNLNSLTIKNNKDNKFWNILKKLIQ